MLFLLSVTTSCAPRNHSVLEKLISGDYFSMRQQTPTHYVGLIQLNSPALLSNAKIINGKAQIDLAAKNDIVQEQENAIDQLKALSPEIRIIASYKLVLNAISFIAPSDLVDKIAKINGVSRVIENTNFNRPQISSSEQIENTLATLGSGLNDHNTVTFIGADKLHKLGISGQNMKVGIIDTGIDYTHIMLGGPGKKEIFDAIDPKTSNEFFPNQLVVGGADFVGTDYSPSSADIEQMIPKRDSNPIDESGHGSHVAGTVSGHGDGLKTYSGVAPEAKLYALKVFGKQGGTSDIAVIEALEFAADITESMNPNERLDVVNLSLGGGYGKPKVLYSEAIKNLTRGGTVVVASAGNSGDNPYIVGAPSTSDEAISVAAGIDDMPQNILIPAVSVKLKDQEKLVEKIEGNISLPAENSLVSGSLVYLGNGADPVAEDIQIAVKGKIALIDRGVNSFVDKLSLATKLQAIGVVVVNNQEGPAIAMGGEGKFEIPAVMITKNMGNLIKDELKNLLNVEFNFSPGKNISRDDLIDTITSFSSRGPRSLDSLIKPEITGPGLNVISAKMGSGEQGVQLSGTSMSGPHIAGVMTLLKQAFPTMTVAQLKAKALNNSKILMKENAHVPVSLQGAGRVQVDRAFNSKVLAMPATLSLGEVSISSNKTISKAITITNFSNRDLVFATRSMSTKNIQVSLPGSFKVKANNSIKINVSFTLLKANDDTNNIEADGFVMLSSEDGIEKMNIPFLAVLNKVTSIEASDFLTMTNSSDDKVGAEVRLTLNNKGQNNGDALVFNLLGLDERKTINPPLNISKSTSCDLEAAGIRIIDKDIDGVSKKYLQVGIKLYDALTMWQPCDISLQIDTNKDGVADLELLGIKANYVSGIAADTFASLLLDAKLAREIRKDFELAPQTAKENYLPALIDGSKMMYYNHANVAVIEADLAKIPTDKKGNVGIKLAVSNLETEENSDDFLANHGQKWQSINLSEMAFAFYEMPEMVTVKSNDLEKLTLKRGAGQARLLVLYPHNAPAFNDVLRDQQSQILTEKFQK